MDDITVLQECVVKVEIKEELCDNIENEECDMPGKNRDEVNAAVAVLLQPKVEMEEVEEQAEELKPLAAVYIKTEVETDEEIEEQDHLAVYPLADCEEWEEKSPLLKALLMREEKEEAAELKEEADARISNERSEQVAAEEMKDDAEDASGSNNVFSPEEREASEPEDYMPTHNNRQPFSCVHGSESFRYKKTLEEHEREHREEPRPLTCETNQHQFTAGNAVSRIRTHTKGGEKETNFSCQTCGKVFKRAWDLKRHLSVHTGEKPYVCEHCGKGYTQVSSLNVHRRKHTGEQPYSCSICNKRFAEPSTLQVHTRYHLNIKPYECKECGKTFVERKQYTVHMRVHTGERPYKCSVCSKTFARRECLNIHMTTHYSVRKQMSACELCGGSYTTTYMSIHMRTHTGERPYKCRFCEATFTHSSDRLKHEEIHSDRKPVQCKECGKSLLSSRHFKSHMRFHTGEKPHKCGYCEKTFAWLSSRKSHEATHIKEYPYNCAECGKGFIFKWRLLKHILTHGKRKPDVIHP